MAVTEYKPVYWNIETLDKDKLNTMTANDQYFYENMPKVMFNSYGIKRTNGVKMMAGVVITPVSKTANSTARYDFGTFFSSGCKPIIVTGTQPTSARGRIHVMVRGINSNYPDNRGFVVTSSADELTGKNNVMDAKIYVHFLAIGW